MSVSSGLVYGSEPELLAQDMFLESLPDDPYGLCPCGCGHKWKFVKDDWDVHERQFVKKMLHPVMEVRHSL